MVIIGVIAAFTLLNALPYLVGLLHAPKYTVFLGSVHFPHDYFYYLMNVVQGKTHWLFNANLMTAERLPPDLTFWFYVLFGKIFWLFHIPPIVTYQILIVAATVFYLFIIYRLICLLVSSQKWRMILFLLFLLSNAFPRIHNQNGQWLYSYYFPWNNYGDLFIRLTNVPHHIFSQGVILAAVLSAVSLAKKTTKRTWYIGGLIVAAVITGRLQPPQWILLTIVFAIWGIWNCLISPGKKTIKQISEFLLPALLFGFGGLPSALYMKIVTSADPYITSALWDKYQQIEISFLHFIRINGPLALVTLLTVPFLLPSIKKWNPVFFIIAIHTILATIIFFSPLPYTVGLLNNRFMSVVPTLFFAASAQLAIEKVIHRFRIRTAIAPWFFALLLLVVTFPVTAYQIKERLNFPQNGPQYYLPLGAYIAFEQAEKLSTPDDTFLLFAPFNNIFPSIANRHTYHAHILITIDHAKKQKLADAFFGGTMSEEEVITFLKENSIDFYINYAWNPPLTKHASVVYANLYMTIYKVTLPQ